MKAPVAARLLDGRSPVPHEGVVSVRTDTVVFESEGAAPREWNVDRVETAQRVADYLHVEMRSDAPNLPGEKLLVADEEFENDLEQARLMFVGGASTTARAVSRRLGLKSWVVITLLVVPLAWWAYTAMLPNAHVLISRENEAALGEAVYEAMVEEFEVYRDPELDALIGRMVDELKDPDAGFDLRVTVIDESQVNAFAAPGGRIVVFSGLLTQCPSPDALAGVLAHEIVHVEQRHGLKHLLRTLGVLYFAGAFIGGGVEEFATAETIAELSSLLVVLKHSRDHEREADELGVAKLRRAGRSVLGLAEFFRVLEEMYGGREIPRRLQWLSTHPMHQERIDAVMRLGKGAPKGKAWVEAGVWDGIVERVR